MKNSISEQVKQIIADTLRVDKSKVVDTLSIGDIAEWDSMGNVAIISTLEDSFGIEFPLDDLFELTSVQAFISKITELQR